jgi:hypothetical protein
MGRLSAQIGRWRSEGGPASGPLALPPPEAALKRPVAPNSLAVGAPEGAAPLVHLTEVAGTPLYLHTGNGAIVSLHHDATLREVAAEEAGQPTPRAFADALARRGSGIDLDALRSLARAVAGWAGWRPRGLSAGERAHAIARGLGLSPGKLAAALRDRPTVFEWLLVEPADLETPKTRSNVAPAPQAPLPPLEVVEKRPLREKALAKARGLDLRGALTAADLAVLERLDSLERLTVRLPAGAVLPSTLTNLRVLTLFGGTLPPLPALESLTIWSPEALPPALPELRTLSWNPAEAGVAQGLAAIARYARLETLTVHNFWPASPKLPAAFKKLAKLAALQRLAFRSTAYTKDASGLAALRKALPRVAIEVG